MAVMELVDVRQAAADVLEPMSDADPPVIVNVVDSLTPPAYMLVWNDPWLEVGVAGTPTMGPCIWTAHLQVLCVASRLEPGPGVETLEQMVSTALDRFRSASNYSWPPGDVSGPRVFNIAGLDYLATRINYAVPTTV
jgi:hypothetical protein